MTDKQKEYQASYAFPCHLMDDTMFDINSAHASIRSINIPPQPSSTRSPEESVWGKIHLFFPTENQSAAQRCLAEICQPTEDISPEHVGSKFEYLKGLAFPAQMENIQRNREGLNQFCILDADSKEALVVTIEPEHYLIEWEGVTIMYGYAQERLYGAHAMSGATSLAQPEAYDAIWSEWQANAPPEEARNCSQAVERMRDCLATSKAVLDLSGLQLTTLPALLPEHITVLTVINNCLTRLPETLPGELQQLNASQNHLTALPTTLPARLQRLDVSHNRLTVIITLPEGIDDLNVSHNHLSQLPSSLPPGLRQLDASTNQLTLLWDTLPPTLEWLDISNNKLTYLPEAMLANFGAVVAENNPFTEQAIQQLQRLTSTPDYRGPQLYFSMSEPAASHSAAHTCEPRQHAEEYEADWSEWITSAPPEEGGNRRIAVERMRQYLENGAFNLDLSHLGLTTLPDYLPENVDFLVISRNQLSRLPETLPKNLRQLYVSYNQLTTLPERLPESLRVLNASNNQLARLPERLPESLRILDASNNHVVRLPENLPLRLLLLKIKQNRLTHLPPSFLRLPGTLRVEVQGNPLPERVIQYLQRITSADGYQGPQIEFSMAAFSTHGETRPLSLAVADWLILTQPSELERWATFAEEVNAMAFSGFLDRLGRTENTKNNPPFKKQVSTLLERVAQDEELREKIFTVAMDATESCEDRVTLAYHTMQSVVLVHDAEKGAFDNSLAELVRTGREMFRLEQLELIAQDKVKKLPLVDEIEVHLGFQNSLRETLQLETTTPKMRFFGVSGITESDIKEAEIRVKTAENSRFREWFALWNPWHKVLARIAPEAWNETIVEKCRIMDTGEFATRVSDELKSLNISDDIEAETAAGSRIMQDIDHLLFTTTTDNVLANKGQEHLLKAKWNNTEM
ncbi:TPA: NEL-type E3 ubiquitin ligase domain-containing protein [Salmonella bongori]